MLKKIIISFLTVFFFMTAAGSRGEAFVPQTPHLLYLVARKIKEPAGLLVHQVRKVPFSADSPDSETMADSSFQETLSYLFPGKLRAESGTEDNRFYVISGSSVVRVENGRVIGTALSPFDHYTDVLLYRDYDRLPPKLAEAGVNIEKVTFQRLDGRICYFIGDPAVDKTENPGLWIDKDSFFPVRYLMHRGKWLVDVRYDNWQKISRTWYPMSVKIFVDGKVFAEISVSNIALQSGFAAGLFDVDRISGSLPHAEDAAREKTGHQGRIQALDREVEEFNKLYD